MAEPEGTSSQSEESISDHVVSLLNKAQTVKDGNAKVENLRQVHELIIHQDPYLLDNFLDEMLAFMNDSSVDVRKFVLAFIEEACKKDIEILPKALPNVSYMLSSDQNVNVRKKIITTSGHLFPKALQWVSRSKKTNPEIRQTWDDFALLKGRILQLLESDNEGIRTHTIKFTESVILCQSLRTSQSEESKGEQVSLDVVPRDHKFISYRQLEHEGKSLVQKLLDMVASSHISSVNLMTCMGALVNVARQRPEFMEKVIVALETLHVNLPPTLAKSQVSSVRKTLKLHLLAMLRHPSSTINHAQMTTLLMDLGATQNQVLKALPANSDLVKRMRRTEEGPSAKKAKDEVIVEEEEEEKEDNEAKGRNTAIDITGQYLYDKLTPRNVADLVLLTMVVLPDTMPPQFQSSYTPIAAAGTEAQIHHLARMMATQLTAAGIGPGVEQIKKEIEEKAKEMAFKHEQQPQVDVPPTPKHSIDTVVGGTLEHTRSQSATKPVEKRTAKQSAPVYGVPAAKTSKRLHQFGLSHITRPMEAEALWRMMVNAFDRIITAEKRVVQGGATVAQQKIIVRLTCRFKSQLFEDKLRAFILADQKARADLGVLWLYEAFAAFQGFTKGVGIDPVESFDAYDRTLCKLLQALYDKGEHKESLFHKLFLEAPQITPNALEVLKHACMDKVYGSFGMTTLREMILTRPRQRGELLCVLLEFSCYEKLDLRSQSLEGAKELCYFDWIRTDIKNYVSLLLHHLLESSPPPVLFGEEKGRPNDPGRWEEDTIKCCLYLFLHLLPMDQSLITELANVYVATSSDIKRYILRLLEHPVKTMGMNSPYLLKLVERCPEGAETLVTRIVHLLTERNAPTPELVSKVRDLYRDRVPDVRCLIPVLTGLTKPEIMDALPKLVRLNPNVVKEVFNRLLFGKSLQSGQPSMTPGELLIILHTLETKTSDDLRAVVSGMNQLLSQRQVYTKEVLSSCIQHLIDQDPLPQLVMRTVLQAFNIYPALLGFIMNIIHRLIARQVWHQPKLWEGFVLVCERTQPHSFQILLQLPPEQLRSVFTATKSSKNMRHALLAHITSLSAQQQSHIAPALLHVLQSEELTMEKMTISDQDIEISQTNEEKENVTDES